MIKRRCAYLALISCLSSLLVHLPSNLVAQSPVNNRERTPFVDYLRKERLQKRLINQSYQDSLRLVQFLQKQPQPLVKRWRGKGESLIEFQRIDPIGSPIYFTQTNERSALTISAHDLKPGEASGLDLTGKNLEIGVWDGGILFDSHDFFQSRAENRDNGSISAHSTHVAGTLAGNSSNDIYDGMALEAELRGYVWDNLENEILTAAENGMLLSNHSWSILSGWNYDATNVRWVWLGQKDETEDYKFGYYSPYTQSLDAIAQAAPFHLMVRSVGNDRNETGPPVGDPYYINNERFTSFREVDGGEDGYDCIPTIGTGKNVLTVGATFDIPQGYKGPNDVVMTDFSAWGPTDDGRIKPDVVASGAAVFSAYYNSSQSDKTNLVASLTGTSMATPAVTGSLALLQEHYHNLSDGTYLRAASLKGLVIHTADEAGNAEGPDYRFGWGLVNTLKASQVLTEAVTTFSSQLHEASLPKQDSFLQDLYVTGEESFVATLCWNDLPGEPISNLSTVLNNRSPMLVHDLDLRLINLTSGETYFPYVLDPENPSDPAEQKDNPIDNVEKIFLPSPEPGAYRLQISHKGVLQEDAQDFSLFVSGIDRFPVNEADKEALIHIYNWTGGPNWSETWDLDADPYEWVGVSYDEKGRVVGLDLSNNQLQNTFPEVSLPFLQDLNLQGNELVGIEDSALFQQVGVLDLSGNALTFADLLPLLPQDSSPFRYAPQDGLNWAENREARYGDSIAFTVVIDSQIPSLSYFWYHNDSLIETSSSNQLIFPSLRYPDSGFYRVEISHPDLPDLKLIGSPITLSVGPPLCDLVYEEEILPATCNQNNGQIQLDLSGGKQPYSLLWNTEASQANLDELAPGTYELIWTDDNSCIDTLRFEVPAISLPRLETSLLSESICGEATGSVELNIEGSTEPYSIIWNTQDTTQVLDSLIPGSYQVVVLDSYDCILRDSIEVPALLPPQIESNILAEAHCGRKEGEIEIEVRGDSPPFQINWDRGLEGKQVTGLSPGIYTVSVVDSLGCTDSLAIELPGSDTLRVDTVVVSDATCGESNGQAEIRVQGGKQPYEFIWNHQDTLSEGSLMNLATDQYHVVVKGQSGCLDSASFAILELGSLPEADFSYTRDDLTFSFQNLSKHAEEVRWDFGDGNQSTEMNPQHTYQTLGNYQVSLWVQNSFCGADSSAQFLQANIFTSNTLDLSADDIRIFPSPASQILQIDLQAISIQKPSEIRLIDLHGRTISSTGTLPAGKNFVVFSVAHLAPGIYSVLVLLDSQMVSKTVRIGR